MKFRVKMTLCMLALLSALFGAGGQDENMPTTTLADGDFTDGAIGIMDLMVKTGLAPSKSEARRLIQGGGVVAGERRSVMVVSG